MKRTSKQSGHFIILKTLSTHARAHTCVVLFRLSCYCILFNSEPRILIREHSTLTYSIVRKPL